MDIVGIVIGFVTVALLVIGNALYLSFKFGRASGQLAEEVRNLSERVKRLEGIQNSKDKNAKHIIHWP